MPSATLALQRFERVRIVRAISKLGVLDRLLWLRGRSGFPVLTVLTYHRVGNASDVGEFDPDVREVDAKGLSDQLAVIGSMGTIVSLDEVRMFFQGKRLPPNPVMLAFDDGYVDCRNVILPILQKAGAHATFFIPTAFPDSGRIFWWDRLVLLLRRSRSAEITLRYPVPLVLDLARDFDQVKQILLRLIKHQPNLDLVHFFDDLEEAVGVSIHPDEEKALASKTILGFRDVRALQDAGMTIASHSHAHRVLTTLSPDDVLSDLQKSRLLLREVLGRDVRTVAYPVGQHLGGSFRKAVGLAGFDLGFTNATGLCLPHVADMLNVPRIAIGQDEPEAMHKWRLLVG